MAEETFNAEEVSLDRALWVLARVHTKDDHEVGFTVEMGARPQWWNGVSNSEYIEAWAAVRKHIHMSV